jgi:hypothetical protein
VKPFLSWLVLLGLASAAVGNGVDTPVAPTGRSPAEAESFARKLEVMERRAQQKKPPAQKTVTITEAELNSYVNLTLGPKIPRGVSDLVIRLDPDRLGARALVDLAEVKGQIPSGSLGGMLSFLSGTVPLEARGRVGAPADGFSTIAIEQVYLSTIPVPVSVVEQLVASATKSASSPQGFDVNSPFRLPYDLKRVRLQAGRAVLEY